MRSPIPPDFATIVSSGIFGPFQPLGGFHEIEEDELGYFVWTRKRFGVRKTLGLRCLEINLCYYGEKGRLLVNGEGRDHRIEISLHQGWGKYPVDLSALSGPVVEFEVRPVISVSGRLT